MRVRVSRVGDDLLFWALIRKKKKDVFVVFQRRERDGRKELKNHNDSEGPSNKW